MEASCLRVPSSRVARHEGLPSLGAAVTTVAFERKASRSSRVANDGGAPACFLPWSGTGSTRTMNDTSDAHQWPALIRVHSLSETPLASAPQPLMFAAGCKRVTSQH